ncbi:unnamed protein product [Aphanomyces euteiches]
MPTCGESSSVRSNWMLIVRRRSYRPNGLKVLRCFPHCCPTHIANSTCGTSLVMQVAGQFSHDEAATFVAFARFETSTDASLSLGDRINADALVPSNSTKNISSVLWYPGRSRDLADDLLLRFAFNEHVQKPWCYNWTSSASAALRNTLHVFKAYLFHRLADGMLEVVGMAQSQSFSIIPYKNAVGGSTENILAAASRDITPMPPPTPPPVCAFKCHFVQCQCEKAMFGPNYIRCNRSNGRKQIRCFPHCCPSHNLHCSCGGPIMIGVDVDPGQPDVNNHLIMYAHGERHKTPEFEIGQEVSHETILSRLHQPGQNDRGDWVQGVVQPSLSNTCYVFLKSQDDTMLRVLNWIASTPFTMSSFRRCNATPTSRTNKYIQVKPTEITDKVERKVLRKRAHERIDSPTTLLNEMNSAG